MVMCEACGVDVATFQTVVHKLCEECARCARLIPEEPAPITERAPASYPGMEEGDPGSDRIPVPDDIRGWFVEMSISEATDISDPCEAW